MIDKGKLMEEAITEMERLKGQVIEPMISFPNVCILVANLQLALRHPDNTTKDQTRVLCDILIHAVAHFSPTLAEFMRLGYNEDYDET
jgi:hypothetical protein